MRVVHGLSFTKQVESAQRLPPERIDAGPVLLRRISEDDAAAIAEAVLASMKHLEPWMPWATPEAADAGSQRARIIAAEGMWHAGTDFIYSVLLRGALVNAVARQADGRDQTGDIAPRTPVAELADGVRAADGAAETGRAVPGGAALVGTFGLHRRIGPGGIEMGYWIHVDHAGRGYGLAAARALTAVALALADVERVEIHCDVANAASAAIPRRLGYRLARIDDREPEAPAETGRHMIWVLARGA